MPNQKQDFSPLAIPSELRSTPRAQELGAVAARVAAARDVAGPLAGGQGGKKFLRHLETTRASVLEEALDRC